MMSPHVLILSPSGPQVAFFSSFSSQTHSPLQGYEISFLCPPEWFKSFLISLGGSDPRPRTFFAGLSATEFVSL